MLKIDDFHITRLDPILDFPRKRQHMHDARVGLARVRSVGRSTEQLLAFCYVRRCGARSTCPRYLESLLLSYPVLLISSFGVSVCCTGLDCRMSHRIWNRGSNGLPKLVQPYAPSILFPVRHPAIGPGKVTSYEIISTKSKPQNNSCLVIMFPNALGSCSHNHSLFHACLLHHLASAVC